jgi:lysophospholipase L1-like esterase
MGLRGRLLGDSLEYRILAVGGSTTESAQLDESEAWTTLLESSLDSMTDGPVWVGNAGRSGLTSREHALHLKYLLPQYPRIDAVMALVGANDMLSALRRGWEYELPRPVTDSLEERNVIPRAFAVYPAGAVRGVSWYRRSALWHTARRARLGWNARRSFDLADAQGLMRARLKRARTLPWVDSLPPLEGPLAEYRRNLQTMADLASANRVRLVLVTSPSLWRERMPDAEAVDLWMGWLGPDWQGASGYFTTGALARAMAAFNQALLGVCRDREIECVDAASKMPRDTAMFYDDVHFTEAGARRLAGVLAAHFRGGTAGGVRHPEVPSSTGDSTP